MEKEKPYQPIEKEIGNMATNQERIKNPDEMLKNILRLDELKSVQYSLARCKYFEVNLLRALDRLREKLRRENPDFNIEYRGGFTEAQITEQTASHKVYEIINKEYDSYGEALANFGESVIKILEANDALTLKEELGEVDKKHFQEIITDIEEGRT